MPSQKLKRLPSPALRIERCLSSAVYVELLNALPNLVLRGIVDYKYPVSKPLCAKRHCPAGSAAFSMFFPIFRHRFIFAIVAMWLIGCGNIDPQPPLDAEGEPIDLPQPGEDWLYFEAFEPKDTLSLRPTIAVRFSTYVDPATFTTFGAMRIRSGDIRHVGFTDYRMTRKEVLFRPNSNLEADLEYRLEWLDDGVRSIAGSPLFPLSSLPRFTTDDELETSPPIDRPTVSWEDVEDIFDAHCGDCHFSPQWQLPELTRDDLVGRRSQQVDTLLVEPFHPARSYLMHKILPDYPVRRFTEQPPPWSQQEPLSLDDIERIEHWIAIGAPP